MKRIVLVFGFIAGVILMVNIITVMAFGDHVGPGQGYIIGYTTMVLAFLMVYFGIRSYRDNVAGGVISYWKGFAVGISITLIASACYVIAWEIAYRKFAPDFYEKYAAQMVQHARASGASQAVLDEKAKEAAKMVNWSKSPVTIVALTFIEPFPVGLLLTLVSAGVLRRKKRIGGADSMPVGATPSGGRV